MRQLLGPVVAYTRRADLVGLLWVLIPLELLCGFLESAIGWWALFPAGLFVVALIVAVTWSQGGRET